MKLSDWISKISMKDPKTKDDEEKLQLLLLKRSDLIAKAEKEFDNYEIFC